MSSSGTQPQPGGRKPGRLGWIGRRLVVAGIIAVIASAGAMAGMEYYTGQPRFCGSCHIMQPYYQSWSKDPHAVKAGAACIDCHYAPGQRHTLHAKLNGLSQMVTYFSGRAGGRRPRPQVHNESCLREGCHKIPDFLDKPYLVRDVKFVHSKHIQADEITVNDNRRQMEALQARLAAVLTAETLDRLTRLTVQLEDAEQLDDSVRRVLEPSGQVSQLAVGVEYVTRARRDIRNHQVTDNLRCTTCHAFNGDADKHFSARTSVCFTCHFAGQQFNTDTGQCLKCHNPPKIEVPVHGKSLSEAVGEARRAGTMDHSQIIEKNVDCRSCHADLVKGSGRVRRTRCEACHDLLKYYTDFDQDHSSKTVSMLHDKHVADLYATCTDCHEPIEHQLKPKDAMQLAGGFLEPVRENCSHCHPDHHRYQVEMLIGQPPAPIPPGGANAMFGSRVNCMGCHTKNTADATGTPVIEATKQACVICHTADYQELFDQWTSRLDIRQRELAELQSQVEKIVAQRGGPESIGPDARQALEVSRQTVGFVVSAKGIHNRNYALALLDAAESKLQEVLRLMGEPPIPLAPGTQSVPPAPPKP